MYRLSLVLMVLLAEDYRNSQIGGSVQPWRLWYSASMVLVAQTKAAMLNVAGLVDVPEPRPMSWARE